MTGSKPLGEVLVQERLLTREDLQDALERQRESGKPLGKVVLEMGLVSEEGLVEAVAHQLGVPFADLASGPPPSAIVTMIPKEVALRHAVVPIEMDEGTLVLAMAEPTNQSAIREVDQLTGCRVRPALALRARIIESIEAGHSAGSILDPTYDTLADPLGPASEQPDEDGKDLSMHEMLERLVAEGGSDLHLTVDTHPAARLRGSIVRWEDLPVLKASDLRRCIYSILTQRQREHLEANLELDLAYSLPGTGRFRLNVYFQKDAIAAAIRAIPFEIRSLEDLGVPRRVADMAHLPRGLVLVTGPTGSGKSTTLAAVIDIVNRERDDHILTVEDPIEYVHTHQRCIVNQREVGADTKGFANALRSALREDPDVILVGEMRDLDTIGTALTAAETGHLVFGTLHTQSAPEAIDRIIDVFPPHQQQQVRVQLAATIQGIVTQQLLRTVDGMGRVIACEVLIATPAVRNLVREGKSHMIYSAMQAGGAHGMQTMDQALGELVKAHKITYELGLERCHNAEDFSRLAGRL